MSDSRYNFLKLAEEYVQEKLKLESKNVENVFQMKDNEEDKNNEEFGFE